MSTRSAPTRTERREGLLSPRLRWSTIGITSLIFLAAFEALAVTTIMPTIARELDGRRLYSLAFSATLAASVVGMVVGGGWADRRGPVPPLLASVSVFVVGVAVSGTATLMPVFVAGRFLQGLGSGAIIVVLYVMVARVYPAVLHPAVFGLFSAAWVVPSMVGPLIAGVVAQRFSWHWVFLGVGALVILAMAGMVPTIRSLVARSRSGRDPADDGDDPPVESAAEPRAPIATRVLLAVVIAVAVTVVGAAAELDAPANWIVAAVAVVVTVLALRPLVPRGTLRSRRGLPSIVLLRAVVSMAFFATEVYLPYLLQSRDGWTPSQAGLILTVGAVSWAVGSQLSGRSVSRIPHAVAVRIGAAALLLGVALQLVSAALELSPFVDGAGWFLAGGGMGFMYTRMSVLVLALSAPIEQGANSAALNIAEAAGSSTAIAVTGLVFVGLGGADANLAFVGVFALTLLFALVTQLVASRVRESR